MSKRLPQKSIKSIFWKLKEYSQKDFELWSAESYFNMVDIPKFGHRKDVRKMMPHGTLEMSRSENVLYLIQWNTITKKTPSVSVVMAVCLCRCISNVFLRKGCSWPPCYLSVVRQKFPHLYSHKQDKHKKYPLKTSMQFIVAKVNIWNSDRMFFSETSYNT